MEEIPPTKELDTITLDKISLRRLASLLTISQLWAVLGALASLVAGSFFAGVWLRTVSEPSTRDAQSPTWLVIESVRGSESRSIRVAVSVDGQTYISYPAAAPWGDGTVAERFPLPSGQKSYSLQFSAMMTNAYGYNGAWVRSPIPVTVSFNQLPLFKQSAKLTMADDGMPPRGGALEVVFSVVR